MDACWAVLEDPEMLAKPFLCTLLPKLNITATPKLSVKKAIMLLGQVSRLASVTREKGVATAANKLLTSLVALDDVEAVLPGVEMDAFKERLKSVLGTAAGPLPSAPPKAAPVVAKQKAKDNELSIDNPMDDLEDILED